MKKYLNFLFMSLVSLILLFSLFACSKNEENEDNKDSVHVLTDNEIIDVVMDNFMPLTKVPRPSHHEEMISQYLMDWATFKGLNPVRDKSNNVMFEIPATNGMEDRPLGILQGHMDMVVAVEDGKEFDPLHDTIKVIRDDSKGIVTADGTSLGADDGIGVAIIKSVVDNKMAHGPLRIIITVDEEDGMVGAFNVSDSWLDGAKFLINIDNEESKQVLVSTASGNNLTINEKVDFVNPTLNKALSIKISKLKGGHSGVDIDKGRLNGIRGVTLFFKELEKENIEYELASFDGGTAGNAIPTRAEAVFLINDADSDMVMTLFNDYKSDLITEYLGIEEDFSFEISEALMPEKVLDNDVKNGFVNFVTSVNDGAKDVSEDIPGLIESSSNLGIARINSITEYVELITFMRSSKVAIETMMLRNQMNLALESGFNAIYNHTADAWEYDPNSKLLEIAKRVYREQNNEDVLVAAVHAGVECGCFKKKAPTIDMISIGPDLANPHTINETLYIDSIPRTWHLLEGLLANYKNN